MSVTTLDNSDIEENPHSPITEEDSPEYQILSECNSNANVLLAESQVLGINQNIYIEWGYKTIYHTEFRISFMIQYLLFMSRIIR